MSKKKKKMTRDRATMLRKKHMAAQAKLWNAADPSVVGQKPVQSLPPLSAPGGGVDEWRDN